MISFFCPGPAGVYYVSDAMDLVFELGGVDMRRVAFELWPREVSVTTPHGCALLDGGVVQNATKLSIRTPRPLRTCIAPFGARPAIFDVPVFLNVAELTVGMRQFFLSESACVGSTTPENVFTVVGECSCSTF